MRSFVLFMFLCVFTLFSCKENTKKDNNSNNIERKDLTTDNIIKILDHPLIFEKLNIEIVDFFSQEISKDRFEINVLIKTDNNLEYLKNHMFFIHAKDTYDGSSNIINMDTNEVSLNNDGILVFKRKLNSDIYDFSQLTFGLTNFKKKKRYFTRTLNNVSIKN